MEAVQLCEIMISENWNALQGLKLKLIWVFRKHFSSWGTENKADISSISPFAQAIQHYVRPHYSLFMSLIVILSQAFTERTGIS